MSNTSGVSLKEPSQVDWDNYNPGSEWKAPPPALGVDGKPIVYFGQVKKIEPTVTQEGYRSFLIDPLILVKSGSADGYVIRFTRASTKLFGEGTPNVKNASMAGNFLKAAGILAKPQKNSEYDAAAQQTVGKIVPFTIDWEARNKDTGEEVKGYRAFPDDPERPGQKKAILHAGDQVNELDSKGNVIGQRTVTSEVLFANARVRFFERAK